MSPEKLIGRRIKVGIGRYKSGEWDHKRITYYKHHPIFVGLAFIGGEYVAAASSPYYRSLLFFKAFELDED